MPAEVAASEVVRGGKGADEVAVEMVVFVVLSVYIDSRC